MPEATEPGRYKTRTHTQISRQLRAPLTMPRHPQMVGESGGLERAPMTFIHSMHPPKSSTQGPEKWRRLLPERRWCGPSPRKPGPLFPGRAGEKTAPWPGRTRIRLRARPLAPALPGPRLPPQQPPAPGLPGRAAARPPWEDEGARLLLLLPPAPRAEAVARETELAGRRGARPLPRPVHLRGPALAAPRPGEGRRGRGAAEGPPTHLRARAATPGGQRHPEPPQPLLLPPPETPLRKRDHWSEAASLPDIVPPSSPLTSPFPHPGLPSRSNCGAEVRFPRSDAR